MSLSIDLYEVKKDGETKIAEFFDDDLETKTYASIFEYFKPFLNESTEVLYDTNAAVIAKGFKVEDMSMSDYYVSDEGWSFWVRGEQYTTPKNELSTEEARMYTLHGTCLRGLDGDFTDKYLNEMYEKEQRYIFGKKDFNHFKKYSRKDVGIHKIEWSENLIIHNSY
jgi:hypothetical protein